MRIQLFRERLSCKRGKAFATTSKVIMGNGCFYSCLSEPQSVSALWKETAQTRIRSFSFLVAESPWTLIKQSQTLTTHNANRQCRVHFYTFVGQLCRNSCILIGTFRLWNRELTNVIQIGLRVRFSNFKPVTFPEPSFFMLVLDRESSSRDEMGLCCDKVQPEN